MIQIQSTFRASADLPDGTNVGATGYVVIEPDPDAAELVNGPDATNEREAVIQSYLRARVADGSLVLP